MKKTIKRRVLSKESNALLANSNIHPVLQRVYSARGIQSLADLDTGLEYLLPFTDLMHLDKAIACLSEALAQQKRILIIGDFDADGATSSALAVLALRSFGAENVAFLVPNRFEYGYGLTPEIVEVGQRWKPDIIITVDNGITSVEGVQAANAHGIKVIITDHHLPAEQLPEAEAIVNPNQKGDQFASKNLAGVGVIFYVMLALRTSLRISGWFEEQDLAEPNMGQFLDLVALGTVADVVPLDKNNRILVQQGLRRIRAGKCKAGILALIKIGKRQFQTLRASYLGFAVAPRLNAAGRLDDMALGIECLLEDDPQKAMQQAKALDDLNQERRAIEQDMQEQAYAEISKLHLENNQNLPSGLCLYEPSWHQGVIGILAGRIKDRVHRPTIAFAKANNDELKGSARSVKDLHIRDILDAIATQHPDLIIKFGGHAMAAGLSLKKANLTRFKELFNIEVERHLNGRKLKGEVTTDGALNKDEFTMDLAKLLHESGPWGQEFPEPVFDGKFKIAQQKLVGGRHLKLLLSIEDSSQMIEGIAFNINESEWPNYQCDKVHIVYKLDINEFRGIKRVQLLIDELIPI